MSKGLTYLECYLEEVGKYLSQDIRLKDLDVSPFYASGFSRVYLTENLEVISEFVAERLNCDTGSVKDCLIGLLDDNRSIEFDVKFIYTIALVETCLFRTDCFKTFSYLFDKYNYSLNTTEDVIDAWVSCEI